MANLSLTGAIVQLAAYAMLSPGGPFPLMCTAFCFAGFGISLQNAQGNGFVGSLREDATTKLGFLHASYGKVSTLSTSRRLLMVSLACS